MGYRLNVYRVTESDLNDEFIKWDDEYEGIFSGEFLYNTGSHIAETYKFIGYYDIDIEHLKSLLYLVELGKLDIDCGKEKWGDVIFRGRCMLTYPLTAEEFRRFFDLYNEDINEHQFSPDELGYKTYKKPWTLQSWEKGAPLLIKAYYDNDYKLLVWEE